MVGKKIVIAYFESQKDLHSFMEAKHIWKPTSQTPFKKQSHTSKQDKKQNSKSSKWKKADSKQSTSFD